MAVSHNARVRALRPFGVIFDKPCLVCGAGTLAGRIKYAEGEFERGSYLNIYNDLAKVACTNPACRHYDDLEAPA